jgi:hypothetical protein
MNSVAMMGAHSRRESPHIDHSLSIVSTSILSLG